MKRIVLYSFLLSIFVSIALSEVPDSQGKDFWITFIPNQHNNIDNVDDKIKFGDSLYIYVAGSLPTTGTITYYDRFGGEHSDNINITDPSEMFIFKVSFFDFELWGVNTYSNHYPNKNQQEMVSKMSFHIVTDNDVAVYAHSQASTTSDAFLVLPTDVLDKDYFIASYFSEISPNWSPNNSYNTPSQFAIVGTEDGTEITITPSCPTQINGMRVQKFTLGRGQTYLVQAEIDLDLYTNYDLTGTKVSATKPVAVFAGHQRATVPVGLYPTSRDMMAEQMLPVKYWGNNAFVAPLPKTSDDANTNYDYYRIISAYDSTQVNIGGNSQLIPAAGGSILNSIRQPLFISANKPIMAVVYKKTSKSSSDDLTYNGDPFMMVLPPKEQFMDSYRVINIQATEINTNSHKFQVYNEQYICVTIPDSAKSTLKIDGVAINTTFLNIPNSDFVYANIRTRDGVKSVTASVPFGISIVGYGKANSYGYTGGLSFLPLDIFPPAYEITQNCYEANGFITEIKMNDGGLRSYSLVPGSEHNVRVTIPNVFDSKRAGFEAELNDWRQDGSFELMAQDSAFNESKDTIDIYGFTVAGVNTSPYDIQAINQEMLSGRPFAFDYPVHNYGKGPQTIVSASFPNTSEMHVATQMPITIQPGTTAAIRIMIDAATDTTLIDTLVLNNGCSAVRALSLTAMFFTDRTAPDTSASLDACKSTKSLWILDTGFVNIGIQSVSLVSNSNCTVDIWPVNSEKWQAQARVIDANYDAIYELLLADSAGNTRTIIDTIQGFTLAISIAGADKDSYDMGQITLGAQLCDTIFLSNYGLKPLFVDRFAFANNVNFSIPQYQLPVVIPPGAVQPISYCYYASANTGFANYDSVFVYGNCLKRELKFMALAVGSDLSSQDNCGNTISLQAQGAKPGFSLADVFPNPASGSYYVQFSIAKNATTKLQIYDLMGNLISTLINETLNSGFYRRDFTTDGLPAGAYMLRLISGSESASVMFSVVE